MLATGAAGLAVYKLLKRTFVRERPVHPARGNLARGRAARSLQLPVGPHAACGGVHLAGVRGVSGTRAGVDTAGAVDRRVARRAGTALSDRRAGRRLVRRGQRRDRRVVHVTDAGTVRLRRLFPPRQRRLHFDPHVSRRSRARPASRSLLVAPEYPGAPADTEPGIIRVASGGVPRDPEDRRFLGWPAQTRAERRARREGRPRPHPHAVHRALRRRAFRAPSTGCRWSRPITRSSRTTCITTCRSCRAASAGSSRAVSRCPNVTTSPR